MMKLLSFVPLYISLTAALPTLHQNGDRIIGGDIAFAGQFPWAAAITVHTDSGRYFCGGAVIDNSWVLTAGHCVANATLFSIVLGTNKLDGSTAVKVATEHYILHPDYNPDTLDNDIALIRLRGPLSWNVYLESINLPFTDAFIGMAGDAIGWGQLTDAEQGQPNDLRWVTLSIVEQDECRTVFGNQLTENMFCAGGNFNEGTCVGDAGGPLSQHITGPYYVVLGVSSFVSGWGCESLHPSGFVRVLPYVPWIRNYTEPEPPLKL